MNAWIQQRACGNGSGKVESPGILDMHSQRIQREPCHLQVYASEEVAENMVAALGRMKIRVLMVHCSACRLIHVMEYRP